MNDGFIRVAACTPDLKVADTVYNTEKIIKQIDLAKKEKAAVVVFPELALTGYSCGDMFLQDSLLISAKKGLLKIAGHLKETANTALVFVGLPLEVNGKLYNIAAVLHEGEILAFIPKSNIPGYGEFYESRQFSEAGSAITEVLFSDFKEGTEDFQYLVPMGTNILFEINVSGAELSFRVGCEIGEDLYAAKSPGIDHALNGALIIVNPSAPIETAGQKEYRRQLVSITSAKLTAAYVYAGCGTGESTTDSVFCGHSIIAENGAVLAEKELFTNGIILSEVDTKMLLHERRRKSTFKVSKIPSVYMSNESDNVQDGAYLIISSYMEGINTPLSRQFSTSPFMPFDAEDNKKELFENIISIQAYALKKRYEHIGSSSAVIGISGGLDSALALLITAKCFDLLDIPRSNITAVTLPSFGTTGRTYENACTMVKRIGASLREINIKASVEQHFKDIGHDIKDHNVTFENAQARERTQILMDIANDIGGLVIGTGDLSELALGWATFNGDHMSMYGVNAGVPKTLIRQLVRYFAETSKDSELSEVLLDIVDTPVSPELLPSKNGEMTQKTEDLVGPYELHDFFLYYMLRFGFSPSKIYRMAKLAFKDLYDNETVKKWLKNYYRRFFSQQFKRNALPDGPKVLSVGLSPRGDLRMPSDTSSRIWLDEVEKL